MKYKVIPFAATLKDSDTASVAANQLESLANRMASEGWDYVSLEQVETNIDANAGCFGIGATPAKTISISMAVFKQ